MKQYYVAAISAFRGSDVVVSPTMIIMHYYKNDQSAEAKTQALLEAYALFPERDGWKDHKCSVLNVTSEVKESIS